MAKSIERLRARELRKAGVSVKSIAKQLRVAKSTASLWVRDIILSIEQLEQLRLQRIKGGERGRFLGTLKQKNDRLRRIKIGEEKGNKLVGEVNKRELLLIGAALYWAEGTKKKREVAFCNSDPYLINVMIQWLQTCFNITKDRFYCTVGINEIHRHREVLVKEFWSDMTGISMSQFRKTSFKKVKNSKLYDNFNDHYGTLTVKVAKPGQIFYDILGIISGLSKLKPA